MYRTTALLSTILLLCFTTFANTTFKPDFKLELDMSFIHYNNTVSDHLNFGKNNSGIRPSGGLNLLYNFKPSQTFAIGFNVCEDLSDITLTIPNKDQTLPDIEEYLNCSIYLIFAIPISYTIDKQLSKKLTCFAEGGLSFNYPLHSNDQYGEMGNENFDTEYSTISDTRLKGIPITTFAKLGVKFIQKNGNFFKIGVIGHLPVNQVKLAEYDLNEDHANYPINGTVRSGFGYYGLSLNYAFSITGPIKEVRKINKSVSTFFNENVNITY